VEDSEHLVVLTTCPDQTSALALADELLRKRLIACSNISGEMLSAYRWKGETHTDPEVQLTLKTHRRRFADVETAIRESHPYELPEILALPVTGNSDYLRWIDECVL